MASKQFEHLQESTLRRLQARIPHDCPLVVTRPAEGGFRASTIDAQPDHCTGRCQVVAAWIDGYVAAWRRVTRRPTPEEAIAQLPIVEAAWRRSFAHRPHTCRVVDGFCADCGQPARQ